MATAKKAKKSSKKDAPEKKKVKAKAAKTVKAKKAEKPAKKAAKKVVKKAAKPATKRGKAKKVKNDAKPIKKSYTQSEIIAKLAEKVEIQPKQVKQMLAMYQELITRSLMKGGIGKIKALGFTFKSKFKPSVKVPAIKKGTLWKNPFNGGKEEKHKGRDAYTKPAKMTIKGLPLKAMKDATAP